MNIAFDANLVLGRSGIERYSRELIKALSAAHPEHTLTLVTGTEFGIETTEYFAPQTNVKVLPVLPHERVLGAPLRTIMRQVQRRAFTQAVAKLDVVHVLGPTKFLPKKSPIVVTIHDLFPMDPSMGLSKAMQRRFPGRIKRQLRSCSAVICPSNYVAGTIREAFPWYKGPIYVTPLAASASFTPTPLTDEVRSLLGIGTRYVLFVGRVDPRKNIPRLLEAWARVPDAVRTNSQLVLLVAGEKRSLEKLQMDQAALLSDPSIKLIYEVPSTQMIQLLSASRALVFATLAEGFGLPIIEGMKCGAPVIASNGSSIPEVGGDAALYVDPYNIDEIAEAIRRCLEDDALVEDLRRRGLAHSAQFTWDETARKTFEVYQSVVS